MNRARTPSAAAGFSLVEMLVVLALIGLVAGLAMPSFVKAQRYSKVSNAVNSVYMGIVRARSLAMRKQRPVIVTFAFAAPVSGVQTLTLTAYYDNDFSSGGPGRSPSGATGPTEDDPVSRTALSEDPFGPTGRLVLRSGDFSFGYPKLDATNSWANAATNLTLTTPSQSWLEYDVSGRLLPNGQAPMTTLDITQIDSHPDTATKGGPEFYFAEAKAAGVTRRSMHVYRKIEINPFGAARVQGWDVAAQNWKGVK